MNERQPNEIVLTGLDGANPLAFLAALGTLRTLTAAWPDRNVRLGWTVTLGAWRPFLLMNSEASPDEIVETVNDRVPRTADLFPPQLRAESEAAGPQGGGSAKWKGKLRFPPGLLARHVRSTATASSWDDRTALDFMAAWASDAVVERVDGIEVAQKTTFDFTSGQQSFIDLVEKLALCVDADDIRNALFGPWTYTPDPGISLRWDPIDEARQYALQAIDPADGNKNPIVSVPGANLLAAAGLAYFPVIPVEDGVEQPGIARFGSGRAFRWPIWEAAVSSDTVRSLVALAELCEDAPDRSSLRAMGIPVVYQANIVMPSGRYRNFTPAQAI